MSRRKKTLLTALAFILGFIMTAGIIFKLLLGPELAPDGLRPVLRGDWQEAEAQSPLSPPEKLTVLSLNMHYGVGREDDWDKRFSKEHVLGYLDKIADLIRSLDCDIVLLQEVDYDSDRSHNIDQMRYIARAAGLPYMAPCRTWKVNYLPFPYWPPSAHYKKVDSGQAVLSRWPISRNYVKRLPKPASNSAIYNLFYLTRSIQEAIVNVAGRNIAVYNVHLEAFDNDNRDEQAEILRGFVAERRGKYSLMAGDFNSIPPEAKLKANFADEPETDMSGDETISTIRRLGLREIIESERYLADEQAALTFPADAVNRRLDYLWYSPNLEPSDGGVYCCGGIFSDHMPVYGVFTFKDESIR